MLERGKRYRDQEFAVSNWAIWKYLWAPAIRCFGILQVSLLKGVMVPHGSGVSGGSLGYANVLEIPDDELFEHPAWSHLADWKSILWPHYKTAQKMLGVASNTRLWHADELLNEIAALQKPPAARAAQAGVFFGQEGKEEDDPYFQGNCDHLYSSSG